MNTPIALQGYQSFQSFSVSQWVEYARKILWKKLREQTTISGCRAVCRDIINHRKYSSYLLVSISVEGPMRAQFIDYHPDMRERISQDRDLFAFQTCGTGTSMGAFAQDISDRTKRVGIAHAFDHVLSFSLEILFPGIQYDVSTITKSFDSEHRKYEIYVLTNWKPDNPQQLRFAHELVLQAVGCTTYYTNALIDTTRGKFPLLKALRDIRRTYKIGDQSI